MYNDLSKKFQRIMCTRVNKPKRRWWNCKADLHLLLQWPHTASIIQRSSRWQDNSVCDVIFWFPRFTRGVSAHTSRRREILFMPGRFAIYSVRKEFLGTGVYVSCGRTLFNFYTVGHPLKTIRGEPVLRVQFFV